MYWFTNLNMSFSKWPAGRCSTDKAMYEVYLIPRAGFEGHRWGCYTISINNLMSLWTNATSTCIQEHTQQGHGYTCGFHNDWPHNVGFKIQTILSYKLLIKLYPYETRMQGLTQQGHGYTCGFHNDWPHNVCFEI